MRAFGVSKIFAFYAGLGALGVLIHWPVSGGWREANAWFLFSQQLAMGVAAGLAMVLASRIVVGTFSWASRMLEEFRNLVGPLAPREVMLLALASGFSEEIWFRGILQPSVGWVLASLVFGVVHIGPNRHFWPWTVMATVGGFCLGGLFAVTGTVWAPIAAHVTVNAMNLHWLASNQDGAHLPRERLRIPSL